MTEFRHSVRDTYRGIKPVTSWFKYHKKAHGWIHGVDYTSDTARERIVDWMLTDEAALKCGLVKREQSKMPEPAVQPCGRVTFPPWVYLMVLPNGTFKIGFTSDVWQRSLLIGGRVYSATSHDNAFQVEQAAHAYFKQYNIGGEFYSADLPYKEVSRFIQLGLTT